MSTHVKQATTYALIVVATLIGAWLPFGRETEVGTATEPIEVVPQIFEAGDRTCVFIGEELECFCPCAVTEACCEAPAVLLSGPQVITVPQVITQTVEVPVVSTGTAVMTETEATSTITDTSSLALPVRDIELTDEGEEGGKSACNQGVGNGPEGCSPGQSDNTVNPDHPHGPNDEGPGDEPGNPGRKGGNKPDESDDKPTKPDKK